MYDRTKISNQYILNWKYTYNMNKKNIESIVILGLLAVAFVLFIINLNNVVFGNIDKDEIPTIIYNDKATGEYLGYHFGESGNDGFYVWYHNDGNGTFTLYEVLTTEQQALRDNQ